MEYLRLKECWEGNNELPNRLSGHMISNITLFFLLLFLFILTSKVTIITLFL